MISHIDVLFSRKVEEVVINTERNSFKGFSEFTGLGAACIFSGDRSQMHGSICRASTDL